MESVKSVYKKYISVAAGSIFLFVMVFSILYPVHETKHDCTGSNCPVCACIIQCERAVHQLADETTFPAISLIVVVFTFILQFVQEINIKTATLISKKVRMDD